MSVQRLEHVFTGSLADWDGRVFTAANHFTVFRYQGRYAPRGTQEFDTFPEAVAEAGDDPRALVYAVTLSGRSCCLPRKEWPRLLKKWEASRCPRRADGSPYTGILTGKVLKD